MEPVRLVLEDAKVEYTNVFYDREELKALKPQLPFGQVQGPLNAVGSLV